MLRIEDRKKWKKDLKELENENWKGGLDLEVYLNPSAHGFNA